MPKVVSERQFFDILAPKLGTFWTRALAVFRNYGEQMSWDVTDVLICAADHGQVKVNEVLGILEEHYRSHLRFQPLEIRGTVKQELFGVNKTQELFDTILTKVLGAEPVILPLFVRS